MRLCKVYCSCTLLAALGLLSAPSAAFAQSSGDEFQSSSYCEWATSYAQFCDFVIGVSSMDIDATGSITTTATTEPVWGFFINLTQCQDGGNGACQVPFVPAVAATVETTIATAETSGSGQTSGSISSNNVVGEIQLELPSDSTTTIQADETEFDYTETSYHSATFAPPFNTSYGATSTGVVFDGPWFLNANEDPNSDDGYVGGAPYRIVGYDIMTYSGGNSSSVWLCETPAAYWSCTQPNPGFQAAQCQSGVFQAVGGFFRDRWMLGSNQYTPAGCGSSLTDQWMWAPTRQLTWTLATLSGGAYTNAVSINGTVWPPQPGVVSSLQGYTICPSGTTFNSQDAGVTPCD